MKLVDSVSVNIGNKFARKHDNVFLTREFTDLGGEGQGMRALRSVVCGGQLVELGYGVYAGAFTSPLSGKPVLYNPNCFAGAAGETLTKLGVSWEPTDSERAYNEGRSMQVPVNAVVHIKGRFARKLSNGNIELVVEQ